MQIYLVGGAVRDKILGRKVNDRDFVVVGATEQEMLLLGYKKVGKSFPVFLHPQTNEEYALARKEVKTGLGHKDFDFIFTPDITLEEDSIRRDFTCNAIYQNVETGEIIDYYNGIEDIKKRTLRHISEHFEEDPLRVLRMCRFAAQLNFKVAPETMALSQKIVARGDIQHLSKDRIWQEFNKALCSENFYKFIEVARMCGVLKIILPELEQMFSVPERLDYHPEGNSGAHTLLALKAAKSTDPLLNFSIMLHDIGKIKTDPKCWPSHHKHDKYGVDIIKSIGKKMHVPNEYIEWSILVAEYHMIYHLNIAETKNELAQIAIVMSRHQQKKYLPRFIKALRADMYGRARDIPAEDIKNFEKFESYLSRLTEAACKLKPSDLPEFEVLVSGIKEGTIAPSKLNEAYITAILEDI